MDGRGGIVSTPSIVVYSGTKAVVKVGRFYRPQNSDTFVGFEIQTGRNNSIPKLYPVDISKIDMSTKITIIHKKKENEK